jgi:hypothetical protein
VLVYCEKEAMMAIPKSRDETNQDDESLYVSPTSDDNLAERYAKVQEQDKALTTAERLKRLRDGAKLFEEMASSKPTKDDEK